MTAPALREPEPMLLRLDRFVELRVLDDDDAQEIVLQFDRPNEVVAPVFETRLTVEMAVTLVERLVHRIGQIRGGTKDGAGPLSSTF